MYIFIILIFDIQIGVHRTYTYKIQQYILFAYISYTTTIYYQPMYREEWSMYVAG